MTRATHGGYLGRYQMKTIRRINDWGPLVGQWKKGADVAATFKRVRAQLKAEQERDRQAQLERISKVRPMVRKA